MLKLCPKCNKLSLDRGRGFKYQCLSRNCCYQGNRAGNITNLPHYKYSDVMQFKTEQEAKDG